MSLHDVNDAIDGSRLKPDDKVRLKRMVALISKSSRRMNAFELRAAREAAGLTIGQAAKLVKLKVRELEWMEEGDWQPQEQPCELSSAFDEVYGLCEEA
jgi:DNA-binding transcriptional regulator YiaG